MNDTPATVEHGETREVRFLRRRRLQIALVVAAIEGVLVLAGSIPWWAVLVAAAVALGAYTLARDTRSQAVHQLTWIAAVSQLVVVLVPVAAAALTALAIVTLVLVALLALWLLLRDRR
jgi:hypothetical protein